MSTLYEIFKVNEDASQDEINTAYERIIQKYEAVPQTEELTKKIQRMKIAYGILSDTEKRKKYDLDLATKRAAELFEKVEEKQEIEQIKTHTNQEVEQVQSDTNQEIVQIESYKRQKEESKQADDKTDEQIDSEVQKVRLKYELDRQINLAIEKQKIDEKNKKIYEKKMRSHLEKEIRNKKRQDKKEKQYERERQIEAYGRYLENQGYKVKYPWTWPRVKRLLISIVSVIIACIILWQIPYVRENLIKLYEENLIIKILIDIILSIFDAIISLFKH